jgi:hypothetical protein
MTREFFNKQYAALVAAYSIARKMSDVSQEIYWEMLQDISDDDFADGVKDCLASCKFFPTIAELGAASLPDIPDKLAPLPALDHERPRLNWQEQLKRQKEKAQISQRNQKQLR